MDEVADAVRRDRGAALGAATAALDSYGHAHVRPVDDHATARSVSNALATAGVTAACVAGHDTADGHRGARARRRWQSALVVARSAAWEVAEADAREVVTSGARGTALPRTVSSLREDALVLVERLIYVTSPPPPPPPPLAVEDGAGVRFPGARDLSRV